MTEDQPIDALRTAIDRFDRLDAASLRAEERCRSIERRQIANSRRLARAIKAVAGGAPEDLVVIRRGRAYISTVEDVEAGSRNFDVVDRVITLDD